jgi:hypothetical protein
MAIIPRSGKFTESEFYRRWIKDFSSDNRNLISVQIDRIFEGYSNYINDDNFHREPLEIFTDNMTFFSGVFHALKTTYYNNEKFPLLPNLGADLMIRIHQEEIQIASYIKSAQDRLLIDDSISDNFKNTLNRELDNINILVKQTETNADTAKTNTDTTIANANRTDALAQQAESYNASAEDSANDALNSSQQTQISEERAQEILEMIAELEELTQGHASGADTAQKQARISQLRSQINNIKAQQNIDSTSQLITTMSTLGMNASGLQTSINQFNTIQDQLGFTNMFSNFIFTNSFKEGYQGTNSESIARQQNLLQDVITNIKQYVDTNVKGLNKAIDIRKKFTDTELLMQDDNIMSNMLMDYLINEDQGTNVEKVYNKLNQQAHDKVRKIQVNNYQTKLYKEYIFMLKIIIFVSLLIVPLLLLNKLELLSYSITIVIIVVLITLTVLFIGHRVILLNSRDSINYDKFRMNFDRENAESLKKTGAMYSKKSPLSSLNLTCIGDDCCDISMSYDNLRNKCILNENFNNIFEEMTNINNNYPNQINVIHQNDLHENNATFSNYEGFISSTNDAEKAKNELFINSLNRSSKTNF